MLTFFRRWLRRRPYRRYVERRDMASFVARLGLWLGAMMALHTAAMMAFEAMSLGNALWLTFTTITTVGYGDHSAESAAGRLATVAFLYLGGIFVLFEAAAAYFEYRSERRARMVAGRWRWNMSGHILVLNVPDENPTQYLCRLVSEFRASKRYRELPVLILAPDFPDGLPDDLQRLGAVHWTGGAQVPEDLAAAGAAEAAIIVVLARRDSDRISDGETFDILHRLREIGTKGRILAESVEDSNRERLRRAGASIVVRPLRGYPEMIVRGLVAPGAELLLEDLFTARGDECWRYDIRVSGLSWAEVVRRLVETDIGIPVGFRDAAAQQTRVNPPPDTVVEADKLYVIIREGNNRPDAEVEALLNDHGRRPPQRLAV